jgi:Zn-dependent peptidase ImmA (M78 family)
MQDARMAQIVPIRSKTPLAYDPRRAQLRVDAEDLLQMLRILREQECGRVVHKSELMPTDLPRLAALLGARIDELQELGGVRLDNPWAERDSEVKGLLNRITRVITVTTKEPIEQRRYTIAHELSHLLHHSSPRHLRERAAGAVKADPSHRREERDAEIFAAALLMPADVTEEATVSRFGSRIDGTLPHDDLAYFISVAIRRKIEPRRLAQMPQIERATLFVEVNNYRGAIFQPLADYFRVSAQAMAIRLVELGLVI